MLVSPGEKVVCSRCGEDVAVGERIYLCQDCYVVTHEKCARRVLPGIEGFSLVLPSRCKYHSGAYCGRLVCEDVAGGDD